MAVGLVGRSLSCRIRLRATSRHAHFISEGVAGPEDALCCLVTLCKRVEEKLAALQPLHGFAGRRYWGQPWAAGGGRLAGWSSWSSWQAAWARARWTKG